MNEQLAFYKDRHGLILVTGDDASWENCIGMTFEDEFGTNGLTKKHPGLEACAYTEDGVRKLKRHPDHPDLSSRDHWSYFLMYMKATRTPEEFVEYIKLVPFMRGIKLWMDAMSGDIFSEWWYYNIYNPGARLGNKLERLISCIGGFNKEYSIHWWINGGNPNFGTKMLYDLTKWEKAWRKVYQFIIPFFPVQNRAWQLKFMPESKRKERQKKILLRRTDKENWIVRVLLGDENVPVSKVRHYPEVMGDRSGIRLKKTCVRTISKIINTDGCYKKKLLNRLYYKL